MSYSVIDGLVSYYNNGTWKHRDSESFHGCYVIVIPLSTVGYTSAASVSTVDSGITDLIHDRCKL